MIVRAIYHQGNLRLLDDVALKEGQEVQLEIVQPSLSTRELLQDLLVTSDVPHDVIDEEALQKELDAYMADKRPLSEIIIEERRQGR
jgi:predicted DNA-binding antitoxin AbrB/MazE fold protein